MTRIDVLKPQGLHWRPGQHVFLRFPNVSILDHHPFTIASAEGGNLRSVSTKKMLNMSFFVRSHGGFARRLSDFI
jgi:predicted ferric reductase